MLVAQPVEIGLARPRREDGNRLLLQEQPILEGVTDQVEIDMGNLHAALRRRPHQAFGLEARQGGVTAALIAEAQRVDWDLHATIIDSLGNAIISEAYRVNAIKIRLIRQEQTRLNDEVVIPTMREHLGIIDAIRTRDPVKASAALGEHIIGARQRAMELR